MERFVFLIRILLKFVPEGAIDNKSVSVQVMAWHRIGIYAALGGNEFNWSKFWMQLYIW